MEGSVEGWSLGHSEVVGASVGFMEGDIDVVGSILMDGEAEGELEMLGLVLPVGAPELAIVGNSELIGRLGDPNML